MFGGLNVDRSKAPPMPSCLVVQHVEPEGPYAIGDALAAAGIDVVRVATRTPASRYPGGPATSTAWS